MPTRPQPLFQIDHCVISVSDWSQSNAFYRDVLGATVIGHEAGWVYRFGEQQLNVHGPGIEVTEVARWPVRPGGSDLCFLWEGPIERALEHLRGHHVSIVAGPVRRHGAHGLGESVYFRDPDGSLLEFISYARTPDER
jgi:catechol 2,3-dioxygenase-like lactoylglutathione lyase family enzyme